MEFLQLLLTRHFVGKPAVMSRNVGCFLGLINDLFIMNYLHVHALEISCFRLFNCELLIQQTVQSYAVNISGTVIRSDAPWTYFLDSSCLCFICVVSSHQHCFFCCFVFFREFLEERKKDL